jgi:hypothetical protein
MIVTANNERIHESDVTHQHWCNIYWYNKVFSRIDGCAAYMQGCEKYAKQIIVTKFNGDLLPWKPIYRFETERLLSMDGSTGVRIDVCDIYLDGEKIGKILEETLVDVDR